MKKQGNVSVDYGVFTALRMLAVEDYEAGRLSGARLAWLLECGLGEEARAAKVVRAAQDNITMELIGGDG